MPRRHYRLRLAKPGANSLGTTGTELTFSTTGGTTAGFLTRMGSAWGGERPKPTEGRTESLPWQAFIGESQDGEEFTQHIADAGGRADMLRRLGDVSSRPTTDSAWTSTHVQATARLTELQPTDKVGEWRLSFIDERIVERETEIFTDARTTGGALDTSEVSLLAGTTTTRVYPMGLHAEWDGRPQGQTISYEVAGTGQTLIQVKTPDFRTEGANVSAPRLKLPSQVEQLILDDRKPFVSEVGNYVGTNTATTVGAFHTLLVNLDGTDYEVTAAGILSDDAHFGEKTEGGLNNLQEINVVVGTGSTFQAGDTGQMYFWMPTHAPTRVLPKHIGGSTGTHAVKLARQVLEAAGVRTDSTQFTALEADSSFPTVSFRVTRSERLDRWLERKVWAPFNLIPTVNAAGEVSPRKVSLPTAETISDTSNLTLVASSNVASHPSWLHASNEMVTELNYTWEGLVDIEQRERGGAVADMEIPQEAGADLLLPKENETKKEHDRADKFLTRSREVDLSGVHSAALAENVIERHSRQTFQRFGDGPVMTELDGLEELEGVGEFAFVRVGVPTYPNLASADRGSTRIMQVVTRRYTLQGPRLTLLDVGPNSQPLTEPGVSVSRSTTVPKHELDVDLTATQSTDHTWHIQKATQPSTQFGIPGSGSTLWVDAASGRGSTGTVNTSVGALASGELHFVQARLTADHRIGSTWTSPASTTTEALAALGSFSASTVGSCRATLSVGPGENSYPIEIVHGTTRLALIRPTTASSLTHELVGLTQGSSFDLNARHIDTFGGTGPNSSADFATSSTGDTAPPTAGLSIAFGEDTT